MDKAFNTAKKRKFDGYQRRLAPMVYKFFNTKTSGRTVKKENISKKELAEELHQPIIQKIFKKKSTLAFYSQYLSCWSIVNKGIPFQLCVIDIYSKYAWVTLMKDEKCITIADAFQKILKESNCI